MARLRKPGPFSGGAPAPPAVRLRIPGRPARIANHLADRALPYLLLVRANREPCLDTTLQSVRLAIFPARAGVPSCADPGRPIAPRPWRRFRCGPQSLNAEGTDIDDLEAR